MSEKPKLGRINNLKKGLYTKGVNFLNPRSKFSKRRFDVDESWEREEGVVSKNIIDMSKKSKTKKNILGKLLVVASLFFIVSLIAVTLTIFGINNNVSTSNVDISVVGPASIESGGEMSLLITITNNNDTDLELADLIIDYPSGTRSVGENNVNLNTVREVLNTIPSGRSIQREIKSVLYGEEGSEKDIIISLEYRVAESNAIFSKERKYQLKISSSPINLIVSPIEEAVSGEEIEVSVSIISNSENAIGDLLLVADYPFGFKYISAIPKPDFGNNIWIIKDSTEGEQKTIRIKGVISGQDEEERVFKFSSGTSSERDEKQIGSLFALAEKVIFIKRPFLGIDIALNGDTSPEYIYSGDKAIRVDVVWSNNSNTTITNGEIKIKLSGDILDKASVSVDKGFYKSFDNTIIWDKNTNGELAEIGVGDSGRFSFSFKPLSSASLNSFTNPEIHIDVSAKGNRVSEGNNPEKTDASISRIVKFASNLSVTPRATYYTGPFINSGPIPPKVDIETTYTITWTVTNIFNDTTNVLVKSTLPSYVRWMGVVTPISENITYNPVGGEMIWNVGEVRAGSGMLSSAREISFQVEMLPSLVQLDEAPELTGEVVITGIDRFTGKSLIETSRAVTTKLSTDPGFGAIDGFVVK